MSLQKQQSPLARGIGRWLHFFPPPPGGLLPLPPPDGLPDLLGQLGFDGCPFINTPYTSERVFMVMEVAGKATGAVPQRGNGCDSSHIKERSEIFNKIICSHSL